jgi:hypothetical protein
VSRARRIGLDAYKRLVNAAPSIMTDGVDNRIAPFSARRARSKDLKGAARFADRVRVPSKWYATDGSGCFYYFRLKRVCFVVGDNALGRLPHTVYGTDAAAAFDRHGGQLTDRRPSNWISAATMAGVMYGGLDGGPRDWGWRDNEDLDLDIAMVERLRAEDPGPFHRSSRSLASVYADAFGRAMAGAR